jgi:hypothetical protein
MERTVKWLNNSKDTLSMDRKDLGSDGTRANLVHQ